MALTTRALPGSCYIYQGEELGLEEVEDLPEGVLQDPMFARSGGTNPGRDGCRVPLPWRVDAASLGFSIVPPTAATWLPQPAHWRDLAVDVQQRQQHSTLSLYRRALHLRRTLFGPVEPRVEWMDMGQGILAFRRGSGTRCVLNMGENDLMLPAGTRVALASDSALPQDPRTLRPNTAAWLRA